MEIKGEYIIPADRDTVWKALNDPEVLRQTIPGCQELEKQSETEFTATVRAKIGPVSAKFNGSVELQDMNPPAGYRLVGEGKGGAAGFAKGSALVELEEVEDGTRLSYDADAKVGGKLASIGSRLIVGSVRKLAKEFFDNFCDHVAPGSSGREPKETGEQSA